MVKIDSDYKIAIFTSCSKFLLWLGGITHIWSYVLMKGHVCPCLAVCGLLGSCRVMLGQVWPFMVIYGHVWLCMVMYAHVWSFMVIYDD